MDARCGAEESTVRKSVAVSPIPAVADLLIRVATPIVPESLSLTAAVTLDFRVLAFAGAIALGVALLTGTRHCHR